MGGEKWTQPEIELLRKLRAEGKFYREIANEIGRPLDSIEKKARDLGLNPMDKRGPSQKASLCWECGNATRSGCSWSRSFIPVDGWTAEPAKKVNESYAVRKCPEFVEG